MKILKAMLLGMVLATGSVAAVSAYAVNKEPAIQVLPTVNINQANAAELSEALQGVGIVALMQLWCIASRKGRSSPQMT